eukprot:5774765-Alexandrium_andersonii.AAC.1
MHASTSIRASSSSHGEKRRVARSTLGGSPRGMPAGHECSRPALPTCTNRTCRALRCAAQQRN